jgi:hypothetical protein
VSEPRRLLGGEPYVLLGTFPRIIAEGVRQSLRDLPVHLETPFTQFGLPESYLGIYTGDVSLWVAEKYYQEALLILERDDGEED